MNPIREALLWASQNAMLREHLPRYRAVRMTVARFMPGEAMDDALRAESRGVLFCVRHIVAMSQEDVAHPAHFLDSACQALYVAGRIHQPVAIRMHHEIAAATKTFARVESAVIHRAVDEQRKIVHNRFRPIGIKCADRADRARHQGARCMANLIGCSRLLMNPEELAG